MLGLCDTGKKEEIIQRMKAVKSVTTEADEEETSVEGVYNAAAEVTVM